MILCILSNPFSGADCPAPPARRSPASRTVQRSLRLVDVMFCIILFIISLHLLLLHVALHHAPGPIPSDAPGGEG